MNPHFQSANNTSETTLACERLHWGIFVLPFIAVFALILPELFFISMFENMTKSFANIGGKSQPNRSLNGLYAFMLLAGSMPGLFLLLGAWVSHAKSEITLTTKRLIFQTGFISRVAGELPLENIEAIYIIESPLGRILGYGRVVVTTLGAATFPLNYIGSPQVFHSKPK